MRIQGLRHLCLVAVLAPLAFSGCGSSKPVGGQATFAWYLFDIEDTNYTTELACADVGAATVTVTLTNVADPSLVYTHTASCVDYWTQTPVVPVGDYYAGFDLFGDPAIYGNETTRLDGFDATDPSTGEYAVFPIRPGENDFTLDYAPFVAQSFTVSWSIYAQSLPTTCAAVGASHVYLDFLTLDPVAGGTTSWVTSPFDCAMGTGVSYAIPYGPTMVQWSLALVALVNGAPVDLQVLPGSTVGLPTSSNVNLGPQAFAF